MRDPDTKELIFEELDFSDRFDPILCVISVLHGPHVNTLSRAKIAAHRLSYPQPHGRRTVAVITLPDGVSYTGIAECAPEEQFSFRVNKTRAIGLAVSSYVRLLTTCVHASGRVFDVKSPTFSNDVLVYMRELIEK